MSIFSRLSTRLSAGAVALSASVMSFAEGETGVDYTSLQTQVTTALASLEPIVIAIGGTLIAVAVAVTGIKIVKNLAKSA